MLIIRLRLLFVSICVLMATGCATLPDTQFLTDKYRTQAAQFENARGPISAKRSAAIVARLKHRLKRDEQPSIRLLQWDCD